MLRTIALGIVLTVMAPAPNPNGTNSFYSFDATTIEGKPVSLSEYSGKVTLVVNTASKCGYTPQYEELEKVYEKYREKGFSVLGFPSNDFGAQEPGSDTEIKQFCQLRYGVKFPLFKKDAVKGKAKQLVYKFLTEKSGKDFEGEIKWNFTKFLVNRKGEVVARFESKVKPSDTKVASAIENLLK